MRKINVEVRSLLICFLPLPESVYEDLNFLEQREYRRDGDSAHEIFNDFTARLNLLFAL